MTTTTTGTGDVTYFDDIDSNTGNYNFLATNQANLAGSYTITITSVTVNGVTYGSSGTPLLSTPYDFTLNVI